MDVTQYRWGRQRQLARIAAVVCCWAGVGQRGLEVGNVAPLSVRLPLAHQTGNLLVDVGMSPDLGGDPCVRRATFDLNSRASGGGITRAIRRAL